MNRAPGMHALRPDDALLLASLRLLGRVFIATILP